MVGIKEPTLTGGHLGFTTAVSFKARRSYEKGDCEPSTERAVDFVAEVQGKWTFSLVTRLSCDLE